MTGMERCDGVPSTDERELCQVSTDYINISSMETGKPVSTDTSIMQSHPTCTQDVSPIKTWTLTWTKPAVRTFWVGTRILSLINLATYHIFVIFSVSDLRRYKLQKAALITVRFSLYHPQKAALIMLITVRFSLYHPQITKAALITVRFSLYHPQKAALITVRFSLYHPQKAALITVWFSLYHPQKAALITLWFSLYHPQKAALITVWFSLYHPQLTFCKKYSCWQR